MCLTEQDFLSSQQIFQFAQVSQKINLNHCLVVLLNERSISVRKLHLYLEDKEYYLSIQSVYRYLKSGQSAGRFPPLDFVKIFGQVIGLSDTEQKLLIQLWHLCHCWRRYQKLNNPQI